MAVVQYSSENPFATALEAIPLVKSASGDILTNPFLDVCRLIVPVLDKLGAAMAIVKSDVGGNIARLDARYKEDASAFYLLHDIVRKEISEKKAKNPTSCANGLLWLTRAMDFLVALFTNLQNHADWTMSQASTEAYNLTLKKWHGWIASSAFTVALKLAPDRTKIMSVLGNGDLDTDIKNFAAAFSPLLQENHDFLKSVGLDDMKAS